MIRLIATDLDGTLLEPDGKLPEGIFETVKQLTEMGICFAACSGRQYGNLERLFAPVADQMAFVCENGALSVVDGAIAGLISIEEETAREVIHDIEQSGMNLLISGKHTVYMRDLNRKYTDDIVYRLRNTTTIISEWDQITEPMLKISGQIDEGLAEIAPRFLEKWSGKLTATVAGADWFDFTAANKGMALCSLMKHLGIQKEEAAAFGDNFNDETMLDLVGYPFIMKTAHPDLHKSHYNVCTKVLPVLRHIVQAKGDWSKVPQIINE